MPELKDRLELRQLIIEEAKKINIGRQELSTDEITSVILAKELNIAVDAAKDRLDNLVRRGKLTVLRSGRPHVYKATKEILT